MPGTKIYLPSPSPKPGKGVMTGTQEMGKASTRWGVLNLEIPRGSYWLHWWGSLGNTLSKSRSRTTPFSSVQRCRWGEPPWPLTSKRSWLHRYNARSRHVLGLFSFHLHYWLVVPHHQTVRHLWQMAWLCFLVLFKPPPNAWHLPSWPNLASWYIYPNLIYPIHKTYLIPAYSMSPLPTWPSI